MNVILDYQNGLWVPIYNGNRYKVCRQVRDGQHRKRQEDSAETFPTLDAARAEADRRNTEAADHATS